jgi:malate dehydrogenase
MVESIILNKHRLIASSVLCEGEYDIDGYFIGVPCVLGSHGVERIIEIELTTVERQMLDDTFKAVRQSVDAVDFTMI